MSYNLEFYNKHGQLIQLDEVHQFAGGTCQLGGTAQAWLNVTYNYGKFYRDIFGPEGLQSLYGKTAKELIPILQRAINVLVPANNTRGIYRDDNYWAATAENAAAALSDLLSIAKLCPPESILTGG